MPFDPTKPTNGSLISSAELRNQFTGLKDLIDWNTLPNKPAPVADGTYTVGIGAVQNGTITVVGGIITGIQEASDTPPPPDFTGSGFGDAGYNTSYNENGTFNGHPAYSDTGATHWIFWSTAYDGWALFTDLSDPTHPDYFKQPAAPANDVQGNYDPDNAPGPNGTIAVG